MPVLNDRSGLVTCSGVASSTLGPAAAGFSATPLLISGSTVVLASSSWTASAAAGAFGFNKSTTASLSKLPWPTLVAITRTFCVPSWALSPNSTTSNNLPLKTSWLFLSRSKSCFARSLLPSITILPLVSIGTSITSFWCASSKVTSIIIFFACPCPSAFFNNSATLTDWPRWCEPSAVILLMSKTMLPSLSKPLPCTPLKRNNFSFNSKLSGLLLSYQNSRCIFTPGLTGTDGCSMPLAAAFAVCWTPSAAGAAGVSTASGFGISVGADVGCSAVWMGEGVGEVGISVAAPAGGAISVGAAAPAPTVPLCSNICSNMSTKPLTKSSEKTPAAIPTKRPKCAAAVLCFSFPKRLFSSAFIASALSRE